MKTIVLDPGHGGHDPGAVNGARLEKTDNLNLALAVQRRLQQAGQRVVMTRSTDVFIPLAERSAISNRNNADIFVSIHRNAFDNPAANGYETFVRTNPRPLDMQYAQNVHNDIVSVSGWTNRGVKQGNFTVLTSTTAPAMLLEMGFITNARDNQLFDQNFGANADAITRGILQSIGESGTPTPPPITPPTAGNAAIAAMQRTLNERYNAGLVADGICGPLTRRALARGLQTELNRDFNAGLVVDGIIGPLTRAAIRLVRRGMRGNMVWILQGGLLCHGFNLALDGIFGPITENAVRSFQASRGLSVDGIAGPITFSALLG
ncbi:MAG: N-acetylmuramoyl-L-alanine amidase [Oscillospiraceae bacterium]|nr:N-acetylmuramoyl-L-alanine amidase [Oscillospiraceae bacterium]